MIENVDTHHSAGFAKREAAEVAIAGHLLPEQAQVCPLAARQGTARVDQGIAIPDLGYDVIVFEEEVM